MTAEAYAFGKRKCRYAYRKTCIEQPFLGGEMEVGTLL